MDLWENSVKHENSIGNLSGLLGWVDFSREARKRAIDALDALQEPGAVDELGLGTLRDAFADAMFPGTSTLQTRAKYFVLVPCAIRFALEEGKQLRQVEIECCRQMWNTCGRSREAGVIGNRGLNNGYDWIQRPPSEIYWAGMRQLEILRTRTPPGLWLVHATRLAAESGSRPDGRNREEGIDDDLETSFSGWKRDFDFRLWQDIYPVFRQQWEARSLSPDLTPKEAAFLRGRILGADGTRGTLLAWCLEHGRIPQAAAEDDAAPPLEKRSPFYRFSQSICRHAPSELKALLAAANAFNRLVFPARVLHNKLLAVPGIDAAEIWREIKSYVPDWAAVDLSAIFALFPRRVPSSLESFLRNLQRAFLAGNFAAAERLIHEREIAIKGVRAKILHPEKLEPGKWVGGGWLDYRLSTAARILRDIANAEGGPHA